ncbi:MAG: MFS transporter, partial [Chloroflexota bacterium]|nr:MFS transporter [Chloroflexota bacterium]
MLSLLRPSPTLTGQDVTRSLRTMVWEGVASTVMFSLGSGGLMAAYALALGANNLQVGLLAALPFLSQVLQIPAILAVERFRLRKAIGVPALLASHLMWVPIGAVPFLLETPGAMAVTAAIVLMAIRGVFAPAWASTWTSWMRDLVPREIMGAYYGRRQALMTGAVAVVGLAASFVISWWEGRAPADDAILVYSYLLIAGVIVLGLPSVFLAARTSEPLMPAALETDRSAFALLLEPWRDKNFSQLLRFLFFWNLVLFLAFPFFVVYMLTELGLALPIVIGFTALSLITNVMFVTVWGGMADRLGSKTVLSLSASLYLLVILGWAFVGNAEPRWFMLSMLAVLHVFVGIAAAGVTLTTGTIAFKVAPEGKATPFLGAASIATFVGAGVGQVLARSDERRL